MKQNSWCALAVSFLLLAGCAQSQQTMRYIDGEQAKAQAVQDAGVSDAAFRQVTLEQRDGFDYYKVVFDAQGQAYEYDIDAMTGTVIARQGGDDDQESASAASSSTVSATDTVSGESRSVASSVAAVGSSAVDAVASASQASGTKRGEKDAQAPAAAAQSTATGTLISEAQAKAAALKHAGLQESAVNFMKSKLEMEKGRQCYDVEFYTSDRKEYDYEIDAVSGEVISFDFDTDEAVPSAAGSSSISAEQAKKLVLEQVPGAAASDVFEFETDYDDGRLVYEGKIVYDGREYEFEIDGYSGAIRSWDSEPVRSGSR